MGPQSIIFTVANQFESREILTVCQILLIWNLEQSSMVFMLPVLRVIMRRNMAGLRCQSSLKLNSTEK